MHELGLYNCIMCLTSAVACNDVCMYLWVTQYIPHASFNMVEVKVIA